MSLRCFGVILIVAGTTAAVFAQEEPPPGEPPIVGCVELVDSTSRTGSIDDTTQHTYAVPAGGLGSFADCMVTRNFAEPITSIKVTIIGGRADDIGYVGSMLVTSIAPRCADVGTVTSPVDVTSEVTVSGSSASLTLRAQENCCCVTGWGTETQSDRADALLHWEVSFGSELQVRAGTGSDPDSPGTETVDAGTSTSTAHFPLGSRFFVQLTTKDAPNTPVSATYSITTGAVQPAIAGRTLMPGRVAFPYDAATNSATVKYFQAVHLGTATLTITPDDTALDPVTLPIQIDRPQALGSTHNDLDPSLIDIAHAAGVPPHMLKGQIQKESSFIGTAYRYEPLSRDLDMFSVNGRNQRTVAPYSDYRLATADGLAQGGSLITEDIDPRNRYFIARGGSRRQITATDTLVSCREIYDQNDASQRWSQFSSQSRLQRIRRDPTLLDFTAQTPVAASYGWFQVMYDTAVASGWTGINTDRNPSFLFDTVDHLANGGGSVRVAMVRLRQGYIATNPGQSTNPNFATQAAFTTSWQRAFNHYNHNTPADRPAYGSGVIAYSGSYGPTAAGPIFP